MKFLRFILDFENQEDTWRPFESKPFTEFLQSKFGLAPALQDPLLALTLCQRLPSDTQTSFGLQAISRHLKSIGIFGRGFGAVIPKWGGLSEIAQVGCRAGAVGGSVYVLGQGLVSRDAGYPENQSETQNHVKVQLKDGEWVTTDWLAGEIDNLSALEASPSLKKETDSAEVTAVSCSVSVISSSLESLFPPVAEGSPLPAAAVIFIASGALQSSLPSSEELHPPVYIQVHSSDTGECPTGQSKSIPPSTTHASHYDDGKNKTLIYIICNLLDDHFFLIPCSGHNQAFISANEQHLMSGADSKSRRVLCFRCWSWLDWCISAQCRCRLSAEHIPSRSTPFGTLDSAI